MIFQTLFIKLNRLIKGNKHEADKASVKFFSSRLFKHKFPYNRSEQRFYEMMEEFRNTKNAMEFEELLNIIDFELNSSLDRSLKEGDALKKDLEKFKRSYKNFLS